MREHALSVISSNLDLIISAREEVVQWLLPALKTVSSHWTGIIDYIGLIQNHNQIHAF